MSTLRCLEDATIRDGVLFLVLLAFDVETFGTQRIVGLDMVHYHE